jgi:hypothetical protein
MWNLVPFLHIILNDWIPAVVALILGVAAIAVGLAGSGSGARVVWRVAAGAAVVFGLFPVLSHADSWYSLPWFSDLKIYIPLGLGLLMALGSLLPTSGSPSATLVQP